jgi:stage V sporulation protein AC
VYGIETLITGEKGGCRPISSKKKTISSKNKSRDILVDLNWVKNWNRLKQPKPPLLKNILSAFFFGGIICTLGQAILNIYIALGVSEQQAGNPTVATVILIAAIMTGFGVFDDIARVAGAGIAVPVTGFANSVTSMAIEFRREGLILGTGAKMFALAGPIIVFGVVTAFIIGLISALL